LVAFVVLHQDKDDTSGLLVS